MITDDKVIIFFCIIDEFYKIFNTELDKNLFYPEHAYCYLGYNLFRIRNKMLLSDLLLPLL